MSDIDKVLQVPLTPYADSSGLQEDGLDTVPFAGPKQVSRCEPHHSSAMWCTYTSRSCSNWSAGPCVSTCFCMCILQQFMEVWAHRDVSGSISPVRAECAGAGCPGLACFLSFFLSHSVSNSLPFPNRHRSLGCRTYVTLQLCRKQQGAWRDALYFIAYEHACCAGTGCLKSGCCSSISFPARPRSPGPSRTPAASWAAAPPQGSSCAKGRACSCRAEA